MSFLIALLVGISGLTGAMLVFSTPASDPFVAQAQLGLEWRALRGAQELSGLASTNPALFNKALDAYAASEDVEAIAIETADQIVASQGTIASLTPVFAAEPGTVVRGDDWVASWGPIARGKQIDKIAVVVSTRPLSEALALQAEVSHHILSAGAVAMILGALVVLWLTRRGRVHAALDAGEPRLDSPATPVDDTRQREQLEDLARELDDRNRGTRLILDNTAQGFIAVDLGGRMAGDRSAVIDRWFGEPADPMLAGYLSPHSRAFVTELAGGLEAICEGVASLPECLARMPRRLSTAANAYDVAYAPLMRDDKPERILLILSDVTEQVARERKAREEREQRELATLAQLITDNRSEFDEFFAEAAGLVASFDAPSESEVERAALRKLKENCAYYGLDTYVELCQRIEATLAESTAPISDAHRVALSEAWARIASQLASRLA